MTEPNPYESPQIVDVTSSSEHDAPIAAPLKLCIWWTILFPLNMIVPLMMSGTIVEKNQEANHGMGCACLVLYLIGLVFCARSQSIGRALNIGGLICALSQFLPLLQMTCGSIGLAIAKYFGLVTHIPMMIDFQDLGDDKLTTVAGGFVATFFTGGLLILIALAIGATLSRIPILKAGNEA